MVKGTLKIRQSNKSNSYRLPKITFLVILFFSNLVLTESQSYAVATRHHIATDIGMKILEDGGNAVDAAIAVAFALSVVNPSAGNLGGGGFMIIHLSNSKTTYALDYRERAPINSFEEMYQDDEGKVIKGLSLNSTLASGVPGTVSGMFYASENFGTIDIKELIDPSIKLARNGFVLSNFQSKNLNKYKEKFSRYPEAKKIFPYPNFIIRIN